MISDGRSFPPIFPTAGKCMIVGAAPDPQSCADTCLLSLSSSSPGTHLLQLCFHPRAWRFHCAFSHFGSYSPSPVLTSCHPLLLPPPPALGFLQRGGLLLTRLLVPGHSPPISWSPDAQGSPCPWGITSSVPSFPHITGMPRDIPSSPILATLAAMSSPLPPVA